VDIIFSVVKAIHILVSILLIITVLLQPGKGDIGSVFGGTTESIFGASGAVPFLTKVTRVLAVLFIISSLTLGYFSTQGIKSSVVKEQTPVSVEQKSEAESRGDMQNPSEATSTKPEGIKESDVPQKQDKIQEPDSESK
jgi:preprotein translocase subunit SecG